MGHHYIGTEHLLLGLIREGEGIACGVLESLGVNLERARGAVIETLASRGAVVDEPASAPSGPKNNVITCRLDDATLNALDTLVEAGVRTTRSDAAAWLIGAGIEAHRPLLDRVSATVHEIRRLRDEARAIASQTLPIAAESQPEPARNESPEGPDAGDESGAE
jgi:ATP-dependent Clp protease ATP-binding subunit ClpA